MSLVLISTVLIHSNYDDASSKQGYGECMLEMMRDDAE